MPGSCEGDPECGEGSGGVTGVVTEGSSEVDRPGAAEHTNDEVAQGRHDVRAAAAADLGGVLGIGDIADVVQRLDGPVPAQQIGEAGGPAWTWVRLVTA
jgi:hypothetical protein